MNKINMNKIKTDVEKIKKDKVDVFKEKHPNIYEFAMYNALMNVAVAVNFVVLWISTPLFLSKFGLQDFNWFIFHYGKDSNGIAGFYSFVIAYVISQIVNFFVQRDFVFSSHSNLAKAIPWYIITVTFAGIVSVWLPPHIIPFIEPYVGKFAPTIANSFNISIQILITYPMMKYVIMKED